MKYYTTKYSELITLENILEAWSEFKKGKTSKKDVQEFEFNLMENLISLHIDLKEKKYIHGNYEHFKVNDPKPRDIHKASVRDRVVHHLLYKSLYTFYDKTFISDSYSCRKNKGTHRAILKFEKYINKVSKNTTKPCYILKCDIKKFFASINHKILINILEKRIKDKDILNLLRNIISSFSPGLPLGNLTSQILVNIYMNEFDQYIKKEMETKDSKNYLRQGEKYYIRYADDFVFLSQDKNYLEKVRQKCEAFLTQSLKLTLHPDKCFIKSIYSGVDFVGFVHFHNHRVLRTSTKRRMFRKLEENDYDGKSVGSYLGILKHGNCFDLKRVVKSN